MMRGCRICVYGDGGRKLNDGIVKKGESCSGCMMFGIGGRWGKGIWLLMCVGTARGQQ